MRAEGLLVCTMAIAMGAAGCGDVCDGADVVESATVRSQDDADDLEGVLCILGDLEFADGDEGRGEIDMSPLADLQIVEGDFSVENTLQPLAIDLPSLTFIGRRGIERDGERFRGGLFIQFNQQVSSFEFDALTDVGGCIEFRDNPLLDPDDVDDLFAQVKAHAFPGSCDAGEGIEEQSGNGGGL